MMINDLPDFIMMAKKVDQNKGLYEAAKKLMENIIGGFEQLITGLSGVDLSAVGGSDVFLAIGTSLATFFMMLEIFATMSGFRFERIEDAVRIGLKFVVCKIILENTKEITGIIYNLFWKNHGIDTLGGAISGQFKLTVSGDDLDGGIMGINYILAGIINLIVCVILFALMMKLVAQIAGILFEIAIHQAVAPIALSTLCNEQARSAGISFIKSYTAVCLQGLVLTVCFEVYGTVAKGLAGASDYFKDNITSVISSSYIVDAFNAIVPIIGMIVLSTAVTRSSDITKRMFGV